MANTLRFKRGLASGIPTGVAGEPLFTTDTFDLYIGNGTTNTRFQKYIASGTTSQYLRGDGSLATFPSLTGFVPYTGATANVDLGVYTILAQNATIASSGSGNTATITHSSGSGIALNITKGGNGEGLYINKTSGTGNAATIIGTLNATTLVKSGGLSTEYLKADGSVSTLTNPITGTGASGQVAYFTSATTQAGSNNLFWDSANGRLGIGTNVPLVRLHSIGDTILQSTGTGNGVSALRINNSAGTQILAIGAAGGIIMNNTTKISTIVNPVSTNPQLELFNAATGNSTLQSSSGFALLLNPNGGNVVIGSTSNSGQRLQVTGTALITGASSFGGNITSTGQFLRINQNSDIYINAGYDTGYAGIQVASNHGLQFATNNTTRMTLSSTGNLGLGVTPSAWSTSLKALQVGLSASVAARTGGSGFYFSDNLYMSTDPSTAPNGIYLYSAAAATYRIAGGQHFWYNAPSGSAGNAITFTQAMTLDASGRLGIGVTSPSNKLDVLGTAASPNLVGTNAYARFYQSGGYGSVAIGALSGGSYASWIQSSDGVGTSLALSLQPSGGNLLIGSTSDSGEKLQVTGTMKVTGAATFSSSVTAGTFIPTSGTAPTNGMYLAAANNLNFATDGLSRFSISPTGAANFSSSVTVATNLVLNGTSIEQNNASGLTLNASNASGAILFRTAGSERMSISSTGLVTFTDNARFSNLKGVTFLQTGGTLLGSIGMDSGDAVTIDNNGFFGLSVGGNYTMTGGNLGIGHNGFGTSATKTISVSSGTAPSTSPADSFQMYSNDVVAGNAAPHFRTENGAVIKLYQETTAVGNSTISIGGGSAVLDDTEFGGYTLRQVVKALQNQGILA
jgi:hypothetical protein